MLQTPKISKFPHLVGTAHCHRALLAASVVVTVSFSAHAFGLNDTGQTQCYDASNTAMACSPNGVGSDAGANPRQDARFGRDAQALADKLTKTGAGAAGFDFSALDASGNLATPGGHACVRDHVTGLIWSTETLPAATWTAATGVASYTRCGYATGWRVPTRRELLSIVHNGLSSGPAIDATYFPGTGSALYWANDAYGPDTTLAWGINFQDGSTSTSSKTAQHSVRMVLDDINHAPTFTPGANIVLDRTAQPGPMSIPGWATGIAAGPASEDGQHLTATVRLLSVTDQKALEFLVEPTLDLATGTLSFTIKHTVYPPLTINGQTDPSYIQWYSSAGLARVEIELKDDGGTAHGGVDTMTRTFTIFMDPAPLAVDFSVRSPWKSPCVPITIGGWDADSDPQAEWVYPPWLLPRIFIHTAPTRGFLTQYWSSRAPVEDANQTAQAEAEPSAAQAAQQAQNYEFGTEFVGTSPALPLGGDESYYASFCYMPFTSIFTGTDSFTFVLVDQDGNVSEPGRVNIDIYKD